MAHVYKISWSTSDPLRQVTPSLRVGNTLSSVNNYQEWHRTRVVYPSLFHIILSKQALPPEKLKQPIKLNQISTDHTETSKLLTNIFLSCLLLTDVLSNQTAPTYPSPFQYKGRLCVLFLLQKMQCKFSGIFRYTHYVYTQAQRSYKEFIYTPF